MRLRRLHQFHPTIAFGDAVGNECFQLQHLIWQHGAASDLYAQEARDEVKAFVRPTHDLVHEREPGTAVLIHVSMGNASLDDVATLEAPKAVIHHNITPARFFEGISDHNRHFAELGREQLRRLAQVAELGIGDSEYNRKELEEAGFARTAVVPLLLDWRAYDVPPDARVLAELADERTDIVAVGQILPQKAVHDVVLAFARYREQDPTARLHLVGSHAMSGDYLERVQRLIRLHDLGSAVRLTGKVSQEELVAYYRGATALVTLSEHEGFCAPLVEAMRFDLPIVAHAAGAIPETLGDAGILLEERTPDAVAAALERAVRDRALRAELIAKGRARLHEFSRERVGRRLREALALAGWELREPRRRRLAVISSDRRCGIHDYSVALCDGLRANGHQATFVGVRHVDTADLRRKVASIPDAVDGVIVEHEAGIFRDVPFVQALLSFWRRRIPTVLSLHEVEPEKFHHYRVLTAALHYRPRLRFLLEVVRVPWVTLRIAWAFVRYRTVLGLMGSLPRRLVVHSDRSGHWVSLLTHEMSKVDQIPLVVMPLEDTALPPDGEAKRALRRSLGLPEDRFVFVSPGFFFRRKRFVEVLAAAPEDAHVVLSGTKSDWEPEYFDEVMAFVKERGLRNVTVNTEFATMGKYVAAADCLVLYYEDIFQSAIATQGVWAGLPMILSDTPGFRLYHGAGIVARGSAELARAMRDIQEPTTYARLASQVRILRRMLDPERLAARYLVGLDR
ncbi:MAG TPA: glycosyltransferase [Candidatus Limnocylindria bacterium]|nr:glycosyltransferase [Candidatus Limnocylindria bacterium]